MTLGIPARYRTGFMELCDESENKCEVQIWLDMRTDYLVRGTIRLDGETQEGKEFCQAFTCFDQDIVVEPPPWLNLASDSAGGMIVTDEEEVPVLPHHP